MDIVEEAMLALGESRTVQAFDILRDYREDNMVHPNLREPLLLAISLTRYDATFEYLLGVIDSEYTDSAVVAVKAMHAFHADDAHRERIDEAARLRNELLVTQAREEQL